ncbi:PilW family protein [Desulfosediminicola flagellatus]|uniref:PilW family protein n=1 Tax=Desulfosediminicola flagellatus TaxID=2569541 RepID=UPI0010AC3A8C|nr:PilW family protein [Desulfosediminicola flagellatus]
MNVLNLSKLSLNEEKSGGFTLIELIIALTISLIIMASIYSAYLSQKRIQLAQHQVVVMQQNLRSAMTFLSSEIRMAGYKPYSSAENTGLVSASKGQIRFSWEKDSNTIAAGPDMDITYRFSIDDDSTPADGVADSGAASFKRSINGGSLQPVADHIVAVEFFYTLEDNTNNGVYDPPQKIDPSGSELDNIRAVTISLLARSPRKDPNFTNTLTYQSASGKSWGPYDDSYRRRILISTVKLRNIGL